MSKVKSKNKSNSLKNKCIKNYNIVDEIREYFILFCLIMFIMLNW